MKQFQSFIQKEFYHIFRDKRTMLILLVMPIIMIILFGYAITNEVKNSRLAFLDLSKDEMTQQIKERFAANKYFAVAQDAANIEEINSLFLKDKIDLAIVFNEGFSSEVRHSGDMQLQILSDGTEPNQASLRTIYAQNILLSYLQEIPSSKQIKSTFSIKTITRMMYNPQQKSEYNFVPGVIGLILILICVMMTSIAIVREKEMGTMEVLLASPLPPIYIVLAKLVPYLAISCLNLFTILMLSVFLLNIPVAGSIFCFVVVSLVYIVVALLLGLLISTLVNTQLAAMLLSLLMIVPTVYLSGIAFPTESMPKLLQIVSNVVPARWYIEAARKLMIQGVEAKYVLKETCVLIFMALSLLCISWKTFKTRLQ